ncbi:MAG: HAMP domain-containing sensor histidine kinase [PVC group bacterium]
MIERLRRGRVLFLFVFFVFIPVIILAFLVSRSLAEKPETINQKIAAYLNRVGGICRNTLFSAVLEEESGLSRYLEEADPSREPAEILRDACESSPLCGDFFLFDGNLNRLFPFGPSAVELTDARELAVLSNVDRSFARKFLGGEGEEFAGGDPALVLRKYQEARALGQSDLAEAITLNARGRVSFRAKDYRAAADYYRKLSDLPVPPVSVGGLSLKLTALLQLALIERLQFEYGRSFEHCRHILDQLLQGNLAGSIEEASFFARQAVETANELKKEGILDRESCLEIDRLADRWRRREQAALWGEQLQEAVRTEYARLLPLAEEEGDDVKVFSGTVDGEEAIVTIRMIRAPAPGEGMILGVILDPSWFRDTIREVIVGVMEAEADVNIVIYNGEGDEAARGGDPATDSRYRIVQSLAPVLPDWELRVIYQSRGFFLEFSRQERRNRLGYILFLLAIIFLGIYVIYRLIKKDTELARLKSDFISRVSHELRTPLATIRAVGEILEMGAVSSREKEKEYFGFITSESERLSRLIDNVLDFSKIGAGKKRYVFQLTDIRETVSRTIRAFEEYARTEGFVIIYQEGSDIPRAMVDGDALSQALINLMHNAVMFFRTDRRIWVELRRRNDEMLLSVKDRGMGISREDINRIFDQFYRSRLVQSRARKGAGLGLSIVRHIAEAHGGRVEVKSRLGWGSIFTLIIPITPDIN